METAAELHNIAESYATRAAREHRALQNLEGNEYGDQNLVNIIENVSKAIARENSDLWSFRVPVSVILKILIYFSRLSASRVRPKASYLALKIFKHTSTLQDGLEKYSA